MYSFGRWLQWKAEGFTSLPFLYKITLTPGDERPLSWSRAWNAASPYAFVFESGKGGRYTYLGLRPTAVIWGKGLDATITDIKAGGGKSRNETGKPPIEAVRAFIQGRRAPRSAEGPKWTGGLAGFWSYDVARSIEKLPELAVDDLGLPDYLFLQMDELWIADHQTGDVYCAVHTTVTPDTEEGTLLQLYEAASRQTDAMAKLWRSLSRSDSDEKEQQAHRQRMVESDQLQIDIEAMAGITSPTTKSEYVAAVRCIQAYISEGDVFQVNLSQRQSRKMGSSPEDLYEWLRLINPSPYMGFLRCPDFQLISASPELLVESHGGRLAARPIAGTRRRGMTPEEDRRLAEKLQSNEKERAEHIMLVDLERNDLGRISEYGTVRVNELMTVEFYSHVMHLVSQVEGRLAEGKDAFDVIQAAFPGGTITGAPKIRTMEIIEELEPVRRGPYTGSMGWIDYNGDMEFNIIIRTMAVKDGSVYIQAGAGIVIDSDPEREYYESLNKAKALWKAIEYSERFADNAVLP